MGSKVNVHEIRMAKQRVGANRTPEWLKDMMKRQRCDGCVGGRY